VPGAALDIRGVRFAYGGRGVLSGVDLAVPAGGFTGLVGPNGAGKSTLVKLIAGVLAPLAGTIRVGDLDVPSASPKEIARRVAVVPQDLAPAFPFRVGEFVLLGRHPHGGPLSLDTAEDVAIAEEAMRRTDVLSLRDRPLPALSGGERQRAVLAAALAQRPSLLLLDEPTAALDPRYQVETYRLLRELVADEGTTVLAVTHDLNLGAQACARLAVLVGGRIAAEGTPEEILTAERMAEFYGVVCHAGRNPLSGSPFVLPVRALPRKDAP
jgi:iron complex transport system ATP-binding protein